MRYEGSLGAGLVMPTAVPPLQPAASNALASFLEELAGSSDVLVGLNIVPQPTPSYRQAHTSPGSAAQAAAAAGAHFSNNSMVNGINSTSNNTSNSSGIMTANNTSSGTLLALATLSSALGDLGQALRMAGGIQQRCQRLLTRGAAFNLLDTGSSTTAAGNSTFRAANITTDCGARLAAYYLPMLLRQSGAGNATGAMGMSGTNQMIASSSSIRNVTTSSNSSISTNPGGNNNSSSSHAAPVDGSLLGDNWEGPAEALVFMPLEVSSLCAVCAAHSSTCVLSSTESALVCLCWHKK